MEIISDLQSHTLITAQGIRGHWHKVQDSKAGSDIRKSIFPVDMFKAEAAHRHSVVLIFSDLKKKKKKSGQSFELS